MLRPEHPPLRRERLLVQKRRLRVQVLDPERARQVVRRGLRVRVVPAEHTLPGGERLAVEGRIGLSPRAYSVEAMMLIDANMSGWSSPRHRRRTASVSSRSAMASVCRPCVQSVEVRLLVAYGRCGSSSLRMLSSFQSDRARQSLAPLTYCILQVPQTVHRLSLGRW